MCWFDLSEYYSAWLDQTAAPFDIRALTSHSQEARVLLNEESVDKQKTTVLKLVESPVHTTQEKFENAIFLWLSLVFTLIRHENRNFRKLSSYWRNRPFYSCVLGDLAFEWQRG